MRWFGITVVASTLSACAPTPPLVDCVCPVLHRASDVTGAFVVHVDELATLSGPAIAEPTTSMSATLTREQNAIVGTMGDAPWEQRVSGYVTLQAAQPENCCGAMYSAAAEQPADWHDADGVHLDTSTELGGAISAFAPTLRVLDSPEPTLDELLNAGVAPFSVDATGMTVPVVYLVAGPGCADETCASRIRVVYRFDRLGT